MITYLKGILIEKTANTGTVLVNDAVGYDVHMNPLELAALSANSPIALHCYHHITDRSQELYGFLTPEIKAIFTLLIENVSGIGPKSALRIVAKIDAGVLENAVLNKDQNALLTLGIGQKTADKIIAGLSGKILRFSGSSKIQRGSANNEASSALISLGYTKSEAEAALREINVNGKTTEEIIREMLKKL